MRVTDRQTRRFAASGLGCLLAVTASSCGQVSSTRPKTLDTFGYSQSGHQTVGCCSSRSSQRAGGSSEVSVEGAAWFDESGAFHEGQGGVGCLRDGERTPVRIGYLNYRKTADAPGGTVVAWVRCPLKGSSSR